MLVCEARSLREAAPRADRRVYPRKRLSMHVNGRRLDYSARAQRDPCLHLYVLDVSAGGFCATSQSSLGVGEHIIVFFPPEGISHGWDAYGRVVRVEPEPLGSRIAVLLDQMTTV